MKKQWLFPAGVLFLLILSGGLFVVNEGEQALVTQFGRPVGGVRLAGLNFKWPIIQDVHRFERRILKWDGKPNQIPTRDKKYIWIDTTARWRIADPLKFYTTVATQQGALSRLDDIIDSMVRDSIGGHLLVELVRGDGYVSRDETEVAEVDGVAVEPEKLKGREELLRGILEMARKNTPDYGIDLIDVQIKRVNYVEQVRKRVYERMISERKKVAAQYRSEGEGMKADILGQMGKELKRIESEAYRQAIEIRGKADAEAAGLYAEAYGKDAEFYSFSRTLQAFRKALINNTRIVLSSDSEFFKYLKGLK